MIIVLTILFIVISIGTYCFGDWLDDLPYSVRSKNKFVENLYYNSEVFRVIGGVIGFVSGFILLIMLLCLPFFHCGKSAMVDQNNERYKALTYKVESGACRDELGLLSKEVIDEVQAWNEAVVRNKTLQNDFWIGVFIPDIYDELKTIDYESYK